ncbi:dihydropteroate synthase [Acidipropionibacterium virtanenii]|uniref:Dihydropteroate synthase n=1 Tax=Acidipropionibacterium virtanenii TaxID=2057246 RepID=A0A344URF3_9ACTN|nr:Dihydropteroate synthase [Acidipropionibacterium virtanenii]
MGVVNVTPDSFSDGGMWLERDDAIAHARQLIVEGADIIDIGGESTRPGVARTTADEELARVVPVVESLAGSGARISVDTMRSQVAAAAIAAGAGIINDVSGGLADPQILPVIAEHGVDYVVMHWRGQSATMQDPSLTSYQDVVGEVIAEVASRVEAAQRAGVARERIIVDPGIGFSKNGAQNWQLLRGIDRFQAGFGDLRVLWGVSRKGFLGSLLASGPPMPGPRPPMGRDAATQALTAWCAMHGAWAVRTHEVRGNRDACEVFARLGEG